MTRFPIPRLAIAALAAALTTVALLRTTAPGEQA